MLLKIAALCACLPFLANAADDFDSLRQQAEQARNSHNIPSACNLYAQALALNPTWSDGWWYLGNLRFVSGQFAEAEDALHHLTDRRPDLAEAWGMRGMASMQAHSYPDALQFMDKSLALQFSTVPGLQSVVLTNHTFLLTRTGRFDDALEAFRPFLNTQPDPELLNALGLAALHRRLLPSEVPPSDRPLSEAAGRVEYELLTDSPHAAISAETLLQQFPNAPGVHYLAGIVLFHNDIPKAAAEFARELTLNPQNPAAESMLAYSDFAQHRNLTAALQLARHAQSSDPQNAGYQYVAGILSDATDDHSAAVQALEAAANAKPANVEYHIALAAAYSRAGHSSAAIAQRRRALELKFPHAN
jgi:tetratricopeptide (TPR) repeat protein